MRKGILFFIAFAFFFNCKEEAQTPIKTVKKKKVFVMHESSEMAQLMNKMYAENQKIKDAILNGEAPEYFSEDFMKIHSAQFTKGKERTEIFQSFSKLFIQTQKEIFNTESTLPVKERYNNAINLCIACHKTECVGPIPRIKKLLIN